MKQLAAFQRVPSQPRSKNLWEYDPKKFDAFLRRRKNSKFVIALSAGKLKLACHLPFLRLVETLNVKVDELWGVSAGAVIGGLWANGVSTHEIDKALDEINLNLMFDIFNIKAVKAAITAFRQEQHLRTAGLFPGIRIENFLRDLMKRSQGKNPLLDLSNFNAVAYNISRFQKTVFNVTADNKIQHLNFNDNGSFSESLSEGDLADIIRASMAMSGIYWPEEIGGDCFLDGGVTEHLPIRSPFLKWLEDVNMNRETRNLFMVAIEAAYWSPDYPVPANPLSIISESFEILGVEHSLDQELFIKDYRTSRGPKVDLVVIRPRLPYTSLTESPDFSNQIRTTKKEIISEFGDI